MKKMKEGLGGTQAHHLTTFLGNFDAALHAVVVDYQQEALVLALFVEGKIRFDGK
jgi:hypothetical protein